MNEILKKRIEEAELAFADREYEVGEIDHDALCKGFFHGAEYALSHQWISGKSYKRFYADEFLQQKIKFDDDDFNIKRQ